MFETYGEEFDHVWAKHQAEPNHVWTLVAEDDEYGIVNGYYLINRIGYFITEVPWTDEYIYVDLHQTEE
jgi:hypothetical protein